MNGIRTTGPECRLVVVTDPCGQPNPRLVVAALRAGALGVLDVGSLRPGDPSGPGPASARRLTTQLFDLALEVTRLSNRPFAFRLPYRLLHRLDEDLDGFLNQLHQQVDMVIVTGPYHGLAAAKGKPASERLGAARRGRASETAGATTDDGLVLFEVVSQAEAQLVLDHGATGLVAKGCESGGRVGETEAFVLSQQIAKLGAPFWVQGGIAEHTAAAAIVGGARGVVLDGQLSLLQESQLPRETRDAVAAMDGSETRVIGGHRIYTRPDLPAAALPTDTNHDEIAGRLGSHLHRDLVPLGQDAAAASRLASDYATVGGVAQAIRDAIANRITAAVRHRALAPGRGVARTIGTRYPVAQGPMTRVSDRAEFAKAVADAGGLPFLALALLSGPDVRTLLTATGELLGDRPWGVGILGFVPPHIRAAQLDVIRDLRPAVALVAGGRPAQAQPLEAAGIRTFLHVPSPGLLDRFLADGARRFVFEGRECGGHVGPRASFPLWDAQVQRLLEVDDPENLEVLFAGGIHDARSAAMVAPVGAPLVERGAGVGVLMGTAYLFTEEAVTTGAVTPTFQDMARGCERTVLLETAPGHATRCVESDYVRSFSKRKAELEAADVASETMWTELEALNLGRLRVAAKGLTRDGDQLVSVDAGTQRREGMYMIGQVATLRDRCLPMADLHEEVTKGAMKHLEEVAAAQVPAPSQRPRRRAPLRPAAPSQVPEARKPVEPAARGRTRDRAAVPPVAIVGMAGMFPGAADTEQYWTNILRGIDCVTEVPRSRWDPDRFGEATPSRWGGFLPWVPFDPLRYGIPPRSLASIESVQLLSLEVSARALDDAGYADRAFDRERTSVIFGAEGGNDLSQAYGFRTAHRHFSRDGPLPPELDDHLPKPTEDSFPGVLTNVIAGRIANRLDLGGVNYTVDAACAASLAALDTACKELATYGSDMVLCGAADVHNSIHDYQLFASVHALSPTGRCRTFDASADGIVLGEGVACVVLKRLDDALRDGDRIYAVIDGIGGASDGRHLGLTAPRQDGQSRTLRRAYERTGTSPSDVKLIEAHGTGTVVGDRTELAALTDVFSGHRTAPGRIVLGSVKAQIGHTKCAAGLAGLIKTARAIYTGVLPPTSNIDTPNHFYEPGTSPFRFLDRPIPWPERDRRAGVSAFGFGGTNFHAVLRSPEEEERPRHGLEAWPSELFLIRAASPDAAEKRAGELQRVIDQVVAADPLGGHHRLRDLAWTISAAGNGPVQAAIVADDLADLASKLATVGNGQPSQDVFTRPPGRSGSPGRPERPKVALLHPGQGSQYPGMLAELFVAFPRLQSVLDLGTEWVDAVFPGPDEADALTHTTVAQPVLGLAALATTRLLRDLGVQPDAVAGHSYGELAALATAGALDDETLIRLSRARARAMVEAVGRRSSGSPATGDAGAMAAVGLPVGELQAWLAEAGDGVVLANHNSPRQSVVSGPTDQVIAFVDRLAAEGVPAKRLRVSAAFHSPLMAGAEKAFAADLTEAAIQAPSTAVWSGVLAKPYPGAPDSIRATLAAQLTRSVRFVDQIEDMYAAGVRVFVEAGPGQVLTQLADGILGQRPHLAVACDAAGQPDQGPPRSSPSHSRPGQGREPGLPQLRHLLRTLGKLAVAGVPVDVEPLFDGRAQRVDLASLPSPAPGWRVNGHLVCRADGEPVEGGLQPADRIPEVTMDRPSLLPNPPSDRSSREDVVREYLTSMRELASAQREVLLQYLDRDGVDHGSDVVALPDVPDLPGLPLPAGQVWDEPTEPAPEPEDDEGDAADGYGETPPAPTGDELLEAVLAVVAERTGYPLDMLDPDLDLEADLSIDSIKRVEIVGELAQRIDLPGAKQVSAETRDVIVEQLAALKTLRAIATWMGDHLGATDGQEIQRLLFETVTLPPATPKADLAGQRYALISDAGEGWDELVAYLREAGAEVELLPVHRRAPDRSLPPDLATVLSQVDGLVHLGTTDPAAPIDARDVFAMLRPAVTGRCRTFVAVTTPLRDGSSPTVATGIPGLMRSLARDLPRTSFRVVELVDDMLTGEPEDRQRMARLLADEVLTAQPASNGSAPPVSVAYRDGVRVTKQVGKVVPLQRTTPALPLDSSSVVVVTGGARGITSHCARALAQATGCRLELLGRSPRPPDVEDASTADAPDRPALRKALLATDPGRGPEGDARRATPAQIEAACDRILAAREVRATLAALDQLGTPADYHQVDVRDAAALQRTLTRIRQRHGRIDAVIHGAGVIEDRLAPDKTDTGFDHVFGTKVDAARTLLDDLGDDVRLVVLFGSISGVFGNRGQVDYSAANDALGELAARFDGTGDCRVVCIHWGPWAGTGMVSPDLERSYTRNGIGLIDPDDGAAALLEEMATLPGEPPEVVIMQPGRDQTDDSRQAGPGSPPESPPVTLAELTVPNAGSRNPGRRG